MPNTTDPMYRTLVLVKLLDELPPEVQITKHSEPAVNPACKTSEALKKRRLKSPKVVFPRRPFEVPPFLRDLPNEPAWWAVEFYDEERGWRTLAEEKDIVRALLLAKEALKSQAIREG